MVRRCHRSWKISRRSIQGPCRWCPSARISSELDLFEAHGERCQKLSGVPTIRPYLGFRRYHFEALLCFFRCYLRQSDPWNCLGGPLVSSCCKSVWKKLSGTLQERHKNLKVTPQSSNWEPETDGFPKGTTSSRVPFQRCVSTFAIVPCFGMAYLFWNFPDHNDFRLTSNKFLCIHQWTQSLGWWMAKLLDFFSTKACILGFCWVQCSCQET